MDGHCPEECITDPSSIGMEYTKWGQREMEAPFEGDQGPEGAVAPVMCGWKSCPQILILYFRCIRATACLY